MEDGILSGVLSELDKAVAAAQTAVKRARASKKPPESLADGFKRVLEMKLTDAERSIVEEVQRLVRDGVLERTATAKLSKREVFELHAAYRLAERDRKRQYVIDTKPDNFWIVTDTLTLEQLRQMLVWEPITAWDTETTGLDIYNDRIVGWSVYLPKHDIAAYVPFGHMTGQTQVSEEAAMDVAKWYLENPANKTLWHNYKYDGHMLLNHGITVANPYWDTQVVAKLLNDNEPSNRLKDLYAKYVSGDEAILFEDLFDDHTIYDKDIVLSGIYAAGDAHKTFKLFDFQKPYIDTRDNLRTVYYQVEQPLLAVDLAMERTGFDIDVERIRSLKTEFQPVLAELKSDMLAAFGVDDTFIAQMVAAGLNIDEGFNVNSPTHLAYLLYDVMGCDEDLGLKFKKAKRSTAAEVVEALCSDHEELRPLLQYRTLFKLVNTYLEKIERGIEPATGRLHSRFNNMSADDGSDGTATGRYSSSEYVSAKNSKTGDHAKGTNLQNMPSKGRGSEVRRCFVPAPGWVFVASDLSQIEPRIIAEILFTQFGDNSMRQLYLDGVDLYTTMAMRTFDIPYENCIDGVYDPTGSYQPRKLMKQGVLAYLYGQSARAFARTMKVAETIAAQFFDGMIAAFPGLKPFRESVIADLLTKGNIAHVETLYGRKRRFPDYRKNYAELKRLDKLPWAQRKADPEIDARRNKLWKYCAAVERQAINTKIQGTAADVLKQAMAEIHRRWVIDKGYRMHASIHDEVINSVPIADLTPELVAELDEIMTQTVPLRTPLKCDTVIMERWGDEVKPRDWDFEKQRPKEDAA